MAGMLQLVMVMWIYCGIVTLKNDKFSDKVIDLLDNGLEWLLLSFLHVLLYTDTYTFDSISLLALMQLVCNFALKIETRSIS